MRRVVRWGLGGAFLALLGSSGRSASAQFAPVPSVGSGSGTAISPSQMMTNPFFNPALNPGLYGMTGSKPLSAGDAAFYLYSANAANGGLGSGRLSGTRPFPSSAAAQNPRGKGGKPAKAAEMPLSTMQPGGGASKFFNPGPVNVNGAGRYYSRRNPYFQNNRH